MSYQRISIEDDDLESGSYADHNNTTASAPPPPYGYDEVEANADVPITKGEPESGLKITLCVPGVPNRTVYVDPAKTVRAAKEALFPTEFGEGKNIRFIFRGKLLQDEHTLQDSGVADGAFLHTSITDLRPDPAPVAAGAAGVAGAARLDEENPEIPAWMLREAMLEVEQPEGTTGDFVFGLFLGFLLQFFALCWLMSPHVPKRQKLGIVTGLSMYMFYTISTVQQNQDGSGSGT